MWLASNAMMCRVIRLLSSPKCNGEDWTSGGEIVIDKLS